MINSIKITDLSTAERYSFSRENLSHDVWISTVDRAENKKNSRMRRNFKEKGVKFFSQYFADWSEEDGIAWKHLEHDAPQLRHVQSIITFLDPLVSDDKPHNLGVNCFAGISRSTAIGVTALVMAGRTVEQALNEILRVRLEAWPNLRILRLASEILGKPLHPHVAAWKQDILKESPLGFTDYEQLRQLLPQK